MEDANPKPSNSLKTTRLILRIFAALITLFYLLAFVPKFIQTLLGDASESPPDASWEGNMVTASFLVYVLGYIFSWWRGLVGGIIMALAGAIMFTTHIMASSGELELLPFLVFSCPMILAGILFIIFWWKKS